MDIPERQSRRGFLKTLVGMWGLVAAVPVIKIVVDYITPKAAPSQTATGVKVRALGIADLPPNTSKVLKINNAPVIIVHMPSGQFKAFSARCTHLGCIVQYNTEGAPHFSCNCHGSQFDMNGKNYAGPAPRPLPQYRVQLENSSVYVAST